jgi:hypothetical protein
MLRDNLAACDTRIGLPAKTLAGLVYATVAQDEELAAEAMLLARNVSVPQASLGAVADFASAPPLPGTDPDLAAEQALRSHKQIEDDWVGPLLIAKASSYSPAQVTASLVTRAAPALSPEALVELLTWISIQQLLHRLGTYLAPA